MSLTVKLAAAVWSGLYDTERDFIVNDIQATSPHEFLALFDWHHRIELELGGPDHFSNIVPVERRKHREYTAERKTVLAKAARQRKKEEAHRNKFTARRSGNQEAISQGMRLWWKRRKAEEARK